MNKWTDEEKVIQFNIKYCNDNKICKSKALSLTEWYNTKIYPIIETEKS